MTKTTAHRPSQSTQKYVKNSKGERVLNTAYNPRSRTQRSALKPPSILVEQGSFRGRTEDQASLALRSMEKVDFTGWMESLKWETSTDLSVSDSISLAASNYIYMCMDAINERRAAPANKTIEHILSNRQEVDGYITRGISSPAKTAAEQQDLAEKYAEELQSQDGSRFLSFSRSPAAALSFSKGHRLVLTNENRWRKAQHGRRTNRGFAIVSNEVEGFHLPYDTSSILSVERSYEKEVVVTGKLEVIDVLTSRNSVLGIPTIVVKGK